MPFVPFEISVAANASADVPLAPYDRLGAGGGRVGIKATVIAASSGNVNLTLMLGSDTVVSQSPLFGEPVVASGPTNETPSYSGVGAPGDPITIRLENTTGTAIVVRGIAAIQNA